MSPSASARPPRAVLVKLAGIGDVAMACRALNDTLSARRAPLELHWVIDGGLAGLAQALLKPMTDVTVKFHPLDTKRLFQGTRVAKAREALELARAVALTRPACVTLLHRDWRYTALVRPLFHGPLVHVTRKRILEVEAYRKALESMCDVLNVPSAKPLSFNHPASTAKSSPSPASRQGLLPATIGILVGGAHGTKLVYREKRWPFLQKLLSRVLQQTEARVTLYGGMEDAETAAELIVRTAAQGLDMHRVENLAGKLALDALPASLERLSRLVSIDSGIAHVASAAMTTDGQRIVALFGPTDPEVWAPVAAGQGAVRVLYHAAPCSPCYRNDGRFNACIHSGERFQYCMKDITVDEVMAALMDQAEAEAASSTAASP